MRWSCHEKKVLYRRRPGSRLFHLRRASGVKGGLWAASVELVLMLHYWRPLVLWGLRIALVADRKKCYFIYHHRTIQFPLARVQLLTFGGRA